MMDEKQHHAHESWVGVGYAVIAFASWGILPLYWKALRDVPAPQILAHRILWSFVFVGVLLTIRRHWNGLRQALASRRARWAAGFGAFFISCNWFIYIWAVNSGHVVEASMGYYINPLLSVALGVVVLKEKLGFWQWISIALAFFGVFVSAVQLGKVPWVALMLAITFALYGLVKKKANLDALIALGLETAAVMPLALGYVLYCHGQGTGVFGEKTWVITLFLIGAGVVTAMPLLWFAQAARRIPLSTVGFIQYISPSLTLILGIFVFGESFTQTHVISFGLIWAALILFSCAGTPWLLRLQPRKFRIGLKTERRTLSADDTDNVSAV